MPLHRSTVSGIHVERAVPVEPGGRPTLLLIHGAFLGAWCWEQWLTRLAECGWPAAAVSLRNHPGSVAVDDATFRTGLTVADYVADVTAIARHLEAETGRPCLPVGHSMGGIVAQLLAAQETRRGASVPGLVLLAGVPPRPLGPLRQTPVRTDAAFLPQRTAAWPGDDPVLNAIFPRLVAESPSVMNEYSLGPGVPVERDHVRCPVLVVSAERDTTIVPRDDRIARHYAANGGRADYLLAEGIGHLLMLETGSERVLDRVIGWLEEKVTTA